MREFKFAIALLCYQGNFGRVYLDECSHRLRSGSEGLLDDELLLRCQRGDETALDELINRHQDRIYRMAFRILRDGARADEAMTEAFAAVWYRCGSWRGDASGGFWLTQVAYRVILDHARTRRRWWRFWSAADIGPAAEPANPLTEVADQDLEQHRQRRLDDVLKALSIEDRGLVHLHYFEDLTLSEIAAILEVSRDVVKTRLARARGKLKAALGDSDDFF